MDIKTPSDSSPSRGIVLLIFAMTWASGEAVFLTSIGYSTSAREYEGYSTSEGSYSTSGGDIPRGRSAETERNIDGASGITTERVE